MSRCSSRVSVRKREELKQDIPSLAPKYELALRSRMISLSSLSLCSVPSEVWSLTLLIRLDLGNNEIESLSPSVRELTSLEQLWLNDNPLTDIPSEIEFCKRLRVLDVRSTELRSVPMELGRLSALVEVDVMETPYLLDPVVSAVYSSPLDTPRLLESLSRDDKREALRLSMFDRCCEGVYREVAEDEEPRQKIEALVMAVCEEFPLVNELRNVVRNCDRLLPADLNKVRDVTKAARKMREHFTLMRRDNDKKRLSADLELKMRGIYYDNIDPTHVEGYIHSIYADDERPLELEDIQFLIKHAAQLFPKLARDVTGKLVRANVWKLQEELTADRLSCTTEVTSTLISVVYPDIEPPQVQELSNAVCKLFERDRFATKRELVELKKLAADAATLFPAEFHLAEPKAVKAAFRLKEHEAKNAFL